MTFLNHFVSKTLEKSKPVDSSKNYPEKGYEYSHFILEMLHIFILKCQIFSLPYGAKT